MNSRSRTALRVEDAERIVDEALVVNTLDREAALLLAGQLEREEIRCIVCDAALEQKRRGKGDVVTVSRNVFIPLTNLCRDRCSYCSFAKLPDSPEAKTFALEEVVSLVQGGKRMGCSEALFCLGDKPEKAYEVHRRWLAERNYISTAEYLVDACRAAIAEGMLPHTNAGILSKEQMRALRPWNASMGLMLESASPRLREKGMPHYYCPDKDPARRIQMHEEAGELAIPFTTGMLLGIGETTAERVDTLFVIWDLQKRYGHVQETILQPFHPKLETAMRAAVPLAEELFAGWVGLARLILGSEMNLQAPPNLSPRSLSLLLDAGVNDWGGISPLTLDCINPEAPWPALEQLRSATAAKGQRLRERLAVYPEFIVSRPEFLDAQVLDAAKQMADAEGYARSTDGGPSGHSREGKREEKAA